MAITPLMNLNLPTPTQTLGPAWATQLNDALGVVDLHDHSVGKGTKIPTAGLNINANLSFAGYSAINLKLTQYSDQPAPNPGTLSNALSLLTSGGDVYWINSLGNPVQITAGGALASVATSASAIAVDFISTSTVLTTGYNPIQAIDCSGGVISLTLPAAAATGAGTLIVVKDYSGNSEINNINIVPNGTDSIDGVSGTVILNSNYGALYLVSDGSSGWFAV